MVLNNRTLFPWCSRSVLSRTFIEMQSLEVRQIFVISTLSLGSNPGEPEEKNQINQRMKTSQRWRFHGADVSESLYTVAGQYNPIYTLKNNAFFFHCSIGSCQSNDLNLRLTNLLTKTKVQTVNPKKPFWKFDYLDVHGT